MDVSLQISKDIVNPIVETKIKEAILAALGGTDAVVKKVVEEVLYRKVDQTGKVASYSSENKFTWIDVIVTQQISQQVQAEIKTIISQASSVIKDEIIKQLNTKKGASKVADALLSALSGTFGSYRSSFNIDFNKPE